MSDLKKWAILFAAVSGLRVAIAQADSLLPDTTDQTATSLTDPELSEGVAALPKLVIEPPMDVQLPDEIATHDQWRGSRCGVLEPRFSVFHHDDKWQAFWKQGIQPYSKKFATIPTIDFTKEMVIGVFMGGEPIPNYQIRILSVKTVKRDGEEVLVVRYQDIEHMVGVFSPPFPVQPFHMRRVPRFDGPIVFEK